MRYHTFLDTDQYPVCVLVPAIKADEIDRAYLEPFGIDKHDVVIFDLHGATQKKKPPKAEMTAYVKEMLLPELERLKCQYVMVGDSEYFKILSGEAKSEANSGYVFKSPLGDFYVIYVPNYKQIFYDPQKVKSKISLGIKALIDHSQGTYVPPGDSIIKFETYPKTDDEIQSWLDRLIEMDVPFTCDIEGFDLKHYACGIGTIGFAWNQHEGIAFPVDYVPIEGATEAPYGRQERNEKRREMLRKFFEKMAHRVIWHNIAFDVYVLIYQLYMDSIIDTEGLLRGQEVMLKSFDCTKLITYLATNSCAGNKLGLKEQSQEFSGNYAQDDIHDITQIPLDNLLKYNLVDCLSTWFVYNKHWQTLINDQQLDIYTTLFKKTTVDIIQMQLTGMPVNMASVLEVEIALQAVSDDALQRMLRTKVAKEFHHVLQEKWVEDKNAKLKVKRVTLADCPPTVVFNPNSPPQLQKLLFEVMRLPVLSVTATKQPSTDGDTLDSLKNHTKNPEYLDFLTALADFKAVDKILTAFIPAMKNAQLGPDGWHYLFGNFNLGGTLSGRLSSSNPNLQNLPANAVMAISELMLSLFPLLKKFTKKGMLSLGKLIKYCFEAPPGWLFVGLDFASLEDRISALTTKDPQKLKVYTDGYDGHSMRAHAYFGDQMPDIDGTSVESINSIADKYKSFRQDSKAPTFALTYQGTFSTLMKNCGFSEEKAKMVEARYHELYVVSDLWVQEKLDQAAIDGYITAAFGLRVRTPLLEQVIRGNSKTPREAEAEGRSAGNALGQSWCLLNSRAWVEFMDKVRSSEFRTAIRPCAQIHDAGYALVRDDMPALMFMNKHLVDAVNWQDHPDITHPDVGLGGEVSIFYPTWAEEIVIENYCSEDKIYEAIEKAVA